MKSIAPPPRPVAQLPGDEGKIGPAIYVSCVAALGGLLVGYDSAVIIGAVDAIGTQFHPVPATLGLRDRRRCRRASCAYGASRDDVLRALADVLDRETIVGHDDRPRCRCAEGIDRDRLGLRPDVRAPAQRDTGLDDE